MSASWVDVLWQRSGATIPAWTSAMIDLDVSEASYTVSQCYLYDRNNLRCDKEYAEMLSVTFAELSVIGDHHYQHGSRP